MIVLRYLLTTATAVALAFLLAVPPTLAQDGGGEGASIVYPKLPDAVTLDTLYFLGQPERGRTVHVRAEYTAHTSGEGELAITVPEHFEPAQGRDDVEYGLLRRSIRLREGQTRHENFVFHGGGALL